MLQMSFDTSDESIPVLILQLFIGPISIFGNGIILYIVLRHTKFRSSICNCLIGLLAFNEIFDGIGILSTAIYSFYRNAKDIKEYNRLTCVGLALPGIFGAISGQLTMLSMALDRFLAIRKPLVYFHNKSKIRLYNSIAISLICGCIYVWLATYNLDDSPPETCSTGASVTKIFIVAYAIFNIFMTILIFAYYISTVVILTRKTKILDTNLNYSLQTQRKVFNSISLILLSYAIFWCIPVIVGMIVITTSSNPVILGYMSLTIGLCSGINSCVGIFIYLAKHQELKEYFIKSFPIFKTSSKVIQIVAPVSNTFNRPSIANNNRQNFRLVRSPGF